MGLSFFHAQENFILFGKEFFSLLFLLLEKFLDFFLLLVEKFVGLVLLLLKEFGGIFGPLVQSYFPMLCFLDLPASLVDVL